MATYIASTDITDNIVKPFITASHANLTSWYTLVDNEIIGIAQILNVTSTEIVLPLHAKIKEYAVCYFCRQVCQDMWCTNNVQTSAEEKYKIKLDWYDARCKELRPTLTREMFVYASADLTGAQRIGSGLLWRT